MTRRPQRSPARSLARLLAWLLALVALAVGALTLWRTDWLHAARTGWELSRMPPPSALPVPVEGVAAARIADTFGAPRGRDRVHHGVDIFAKRGTAVLSSTDGVVASVREGGLGGRQVWIYGPGGERHYYAHLDDWAPGLERGQVVAAGDVLGIVGDTGNAAGTPPHLHYGIYGAAGPYDPLPLLRAPVRVDDAPDARTE